MTQYQADHDIEQFHRETYRCTWALVDAMQEDAGLRCFDTFVPPVVKRERVDDGSDPFEGD